VFFDGLIHGGEAYALGGLTVYTGDLYMDNIGNQIFIVHYKHENKQKLYYYIQYLGGGLQYIWGELIFGMV
jgi:hypothetical protein